MNECTARCRPKRLWWWKGMLDEGEEGEEGEEGGEEGRVEVEWSEVSKGGQAFTALASWLGLWLRHAGDGAGEGRRSLRLGDWF
jgi:hypothetical protein